MNIGSKDTVLLITDKRHFITIEVMTCEGHRAEMLTIFHREKCHGNGIKSWNKARIIGRAV